jgi:hypothetical protein
VFSQISTDNFQMKNEMSIGRAGELLAASIVETFGYRTALCQQQGLDMILIDGNDYYKCEVKATKTLSKDKVKRYAFTTSTGTNPKRPIDHNDVDIICLVALDVRKCWFIKANKDVKIRTNVGFERMVNNEEAEQLNRVIEDLRSEKCGKR